MATVPAAVAGFAKAQGEGEFDADGTMVNATEGWREAKIGIFAKRERGESVETSQWAERVLPAPTARFAFARIANCEDFVADWGPMGVRRHCWWQICSLRRSFDCGEEIPFW